MPRFDGVLQEVTYATAPTAVPNQSGVCGAVSRPASRAVLGWDGRVAHVVSLGQGTYFHALEALLAFMRRVLTEVSEPPGVEC